MNHKERIRDELKKAGFTGYGLLKTESRNLPDIIHPSEHIMAAVYGTSDTGSAMLIATDMRVLFYDKKPFHRMLDEISYEIIGGVSYDKQAGLSHVILKTRGGDYAIRRANPFLAEKFIDYIEQARIDLPSKTKPKTPRAEDKAEKHTLTDLEKPLFSEVALKFLQAKDIGVLATVDRTNKPHAATIYYTADQYGVIRFLTKSGTQKARDIVNHHNVAFSAYDEANLQTIQLQAYAEIESDETMRQYTYSTISRERRYNSKTRKPPVTELSEGSFTVIRLTPTSVKYTDFSK